MLFSDTYKILQSPCEGVFKDRGSKFMAYAFPIFREDELKPILHQIKKEHFAAAHHCYAYVLGAGKEIEKANDDREPANTAGKPILRSILSKDLTNTVVIVVRYFGGKLLGVPGLINAYGEAANDALNNGIIIEKIVCEHYQLSFEYEQENEAFRIIKHFGLKILQHHHTEKISLIFEVRKSQADQVIKAIKEKHFFEVKFLSEH
ncbi:MAG: YigZ family protein [Bacteroidota bacterium]